MADDFSNATFASILALTQSRVHGSLVLLHRSSRIHGADASPQRYSDWQDKHSRI